jgi:Pyruvate/2-oxoacid:ferredoxin oxidoreductase delta subunit
MEAAFREDPADKPWIDFYHCSGCMKCKANCPAEAIIEISHPCDGKPRMGW